MCTLIIVEVELKASVKIRLINVHINYILGESITHPQGSHTMGRFLGIIGWGPSVCKSNWLHVNILQFFFYESGVYSIDSTKMVGNFPGILNFNRLFLKLKWFFYN